MPPRSTHSEPLERVAVTTPVEPLERIAIAFERIAAAAESIAHDNSLGRVNSDVATDQSMAMIQEMMGKLFGGFGGQ